MEDDINEMLLKAHARSYKRAFETAVRTGTALVFARDGKIVEIKPDTKESIAYRDFLKKSTKFDMNRMIRSLSDDEFNTLIKKMENYEGWHPWPEGEEYTPIQKVGGVKMSNHRITSYLILNPPEQRWVTREEAINLAEKHLLRAVVVHNKKHTYLRPFPHETPYKNLIC